MNNPSSRTHRVACLRLTLILLAIWFFVSLGCSILFRNWMDANMPAIGNAPFGFWMAQQGSIICFVLLLITYAALMYRLDSKHGYVESDTKD
jgi:putative solute:sodium symporter small subunit